MARVTDPAERSRHSCLIGALYPRSLPVHFVVLGSSIVAALCNSSLFHNSPKGNATHN